MAFEPAGKFYPAASEEIATMLGLGAQKAQAPVSSQPDVAAEVVSVFPESSTVPIVTREHIEADVAAITGKQPESVSTRQDVLGHGAKQYAAARAFGKVMLAVLPYVVVFAVGVFVYYGWFSDPSNRPQFFKGIEKKADDPTAQKRAAFVAFQKTEKNDFAAWIKQYYFSVSDQTILDMDYVAPNKLTNFENYLLKLNPKTNDIRGTGSTDAEAVLKGVDPVTGVSLADWQRDIVAQYFDTEAIKQRVPGAAVLVRQIVLPRGPARAQVGQVAGSSTAAPVAPAPAQPSPPAHTTPTTSLGDCAENKLKINTAIPGRLEVPAMGVNVPIIWTRSEKNFDEDLKSGVVHYPCTPLPGDIGTSYVSGHSSNYSWVNAAYNKVFAQMGSLQNGATFKVTAVGQDGKDIRLYYVVERKQVFDANDQAQFTNTADSIVALSTCWPINTTKQRMVAFGKLDRVER